MMNMAHSNNNKALQQQVAAVAVMTTTSIQPEQQQDEEEEVFVAHGVGYDDDDDGADHIGEPQHHQQPSWYTSLGLEEEMTLFDIIIGVLEAALMRPELQMKTHLDDLQDRVAAATTSTSTTTTTTANNHIDLGLIGTNGIQGGAGAAATTTTIRSSSTSPSSSILADLLHSLPHYDDPVFQGGAAGGGPHLRYIQYYKQDLLGRVDDFLDTFLDQHLVVSGGGGGSHADNISHSHSSSSDQEDGEDPSCVIISMRVRDYLSRYPPLTSEVREYIMARHVDEISEELTELLGVGGIGGGDGEGEEERGGGGAAAVSWERFETLWKVRDSIDG